jgi:S-adenosylmethionine hydrolase
VLWVDPFGNLVTSLKPPVAALRVGTALVDRVVRTFRDAPPATPVFYVGSMGFVEVALRERSAASVLDARVGTPVERIDGDPTS